MGEIFSTAASAQKQGASNCTGREVILGQQFHSCGRQHACTRHARGMLCRLGYSGPGGRSSHASLLRVVMDCAARRFVARSNNATPRGCTGYGIFGGVKRCRQDSAPGLPEPACCKLRWQLICRHHIWANIPCRRPRCVAVEHPGRGALRARGAKHLATLHFFEQLPWPESGSAADAMKPHAPGRHRASRTDTMNASLVQQGDRACSGNC